MVVLTIEARTDVHTDTILILHIVVSSCNSVSLLFFPPLLIQRLREPCLVHAQLCCLAAAGLLHPARPSELTQQLGGPGWAAAVQVERRVGVAG